MKEELVWVEAKEAMAALGISHRSAKLTKMCQKGQIQRKHNESPTHPFSIYRYGVPRRLLDAISPSLFAQEDSSAHLQPGLSLVEEQIQRIAKAVALIIESVLADELRKETTCAITIAPGEPQHEDPTHDLQRIIEERAEKMARRIGFGSTAAALDNLQNVKTSMGDRKQTEIAISALERRVNRFNETNHASVTMQDVAQDFKLYLAVCLERSHRQRNINTRQSVRDRLGRLLAHIAHHTNPAA